MRPLPYWKSPMLLPSKPALAALVILSVGGLAACGAPDRSEGAPAATSPADPAPTQVAPVAPPTALPGTDPADTPEPVVEPEAAPVAAAAPPTPAPVAATTPAPVVRAVPAAFARCAGCHSVDQGAAHKMGPNLFGVAGARAGTRAGYTYSDAMASSGVTWTDAALDQFLAAPRDVVPGTKMAAPPLADPAARASIVAYLRTLE